MRRHRKFALWMGVIMAVSAVTSEVPDDICEVVKAAENTVSMTDFASSGEAAGTITISTGEELTLFAEYVNAGNSTKGRSFCLTSDITLNEASYQYQDASKRTGIYCDEALIGFHLAQKYIGMQQLPSFACYNVVKNPQIETFKENLRRHLRQIFG